VPATLQGRRELRRGLAVINSYLQAHHLLNARVLLRLDGQYGTGAVLKELAGFAFVTRGKDYTVLDQPEIQTRLHLPADGQQCRPESQTTRTLYDCPEVLVGPEGVSCRVVVAIHPVGKTKSRVGVTRDGWVYELFFTSLPQQSFTAVDIVELYLHRGAFEPALSDEDAELDPDRWCSHAACGQECWQLIAQWVWNLRQERRREQDGSLRILYAARIADCRDCSLRELCQWHGAAATKSRRMSVLLPPLQIGPHPLFWKDWPRRAHRRACMQLLRHQRVEVHLLPAGDAQAPARPQVLSRAQRAHYRLPEAERLARNARAPTAGPVSLTLFGVPEHFATFLGLQAA
jgi:hypothetical protein